MDVVAASEMTAIAAGGAERVRRWVGASPEWIVFALGALLRLRLRESFDPNWSYDVTPHTEYVAYIVDHHALPPLDAQREACNQPLYYVIAALITAAGGTYADVQLVSIFSGIATLALIWVALRRFFPNDRVARLFGLSIAAVLPCAIHSDGMITNEALLGAMSTAALLFVPPTMEASGRRRWLAGMLLGLFFALALLTKISPILFCFAFAGGAVAALVWDREGGVIASARRRLPLVVGVSIALAVALPVNARHYASTGLLFPTGYDTARVHDVSAIPLWRRRPLAFYVAPCKASLIGQPYYPNCSSPDARFAPVLVATTFGDYYNYRYAGFPQGDEPTVLANGRDLSVRALRWMRASILAGFSIATVTVLGLCAALRGALKSKNAVIVTGVLVSVIAVLGQLLWSVRYPYDGFGPIKGSYLQFASAPLFLFFGGACSCLWKRRGWKVLAWAQIFAIATVAGYSIFARSHGFYD